MTQSGLQYKDLRAGSGGEGPSEGDTVVVDWDGYTIGYYGRPFEARNKVRHVQWGLVHHCCHMCHLSLPPHPTQHNSTQHNRNSTTATAQHNTNRPTNLTHPPCPRSPRAAPSLATTRTTCALCWARVR